MNLLERDYWIAHVGWASNNGNIWGQYNRMVAYMFESYPKTKKRFDEIALPLLNTISHGVELGLKENIIFFLEYATVNTLKNFESTLDMEKSHDLDLLADEFKNLYSRLHKQFRMGKEEKQEFAKYYFALSTLLKVLERSTETYRYSKKMDKKGNKVKSSIAPNKKIDFLQVKELYGEVNTLLIGAPNSLSSFTDYIDFIRANSNYKGGKGFLYCQRIHYTKDFHEELIKELDKKFKKQKENLWFDPETRENYEIQVLDNDMYIIAVDPRLR